MDAAAAFLASLEESKITSLQDAAKKPPIEILPPGLASLYGPNPGQPGQKKPGLALPSSQQQPSKPLLLEASAATPGSISTSSESNNLSSTESGSTHNSTGVPAASPMSEHASTPSESIAPAQSEPDSSALPVNGSSDHGPPNHNTVENLEQSALVQSVPEANGTEGRGPAAYETIAVTPDASHQQTNNQGTGVRAELSMIDFT